MLQLDLSSYLIDVYTHSEAASEWQNQPEELEEHLVAIERWWSRHKEVGDRMPTGLAYMMLAHLNMLKGYIYAIDSGKDWKSQYRRIFRIKGEILEQFGHANELWERSIIADEGEPQQHA